MGIRGTSAPVVLSDIGKAVKLLDLQKVYDSGDIGRCMPAANHRGTVAFAVSNYSSPPQRLVYVLDDDLTPRLLADLYAYDSSISHLELPFMTSAGTILVQSGCMNIYRITSTGSISKVFGVVGTGGYGYECWAEDVEYLGSSSSGTIIAGYQESPGGDIVIIKSTNDGMTWTEVYRGVHSTTTTSVMGAGIHYGKVFVLLGNGIILSGDEDGTGWAEVYDSADDDGPEWAGDGMTTVDGTVYAVGSYFTLICPNHLTPTVWFRVALPYKSGYPSYKYDNWRSPRGRGRYLSVAAVEGPYYSTVRHLVSEDGFYTVREAFRIPAGANSSSGFYRVARHDNAMFIGVSGYERCMLFRGYIPPTLGQRQPLAWRILRVDNLDASDTSSLGSCYAFEPALGSGLNLTVECTYHASATSGGQLKLYSSRDGLNWDTEVIETAKTLAFTAGETKRETFTPSGAAQMSRYLKATVTNLDASRAMTDIRVYAILKG